MRRCALLRDTRGMTIIEIAVVIIIIGLMFGAGVYYLGTFNIAKLKTETNKLGAMIRYVNNLAIINNSYYQLTIDLEGNRYSAEAVKITDSYCSPVVSMAKEAEKEAKAAKEKGHGGTELLAPEHKADLHKGGGGPGGGAGGHDGLEGGGSGMKIKDMIIRGRKMESPIKFLSVVSEHGGNTDEGKVKILFYPDGVIEKALIHVGYEDEVNTVEILPGLGCAKIHREKVDKNIEILK